MDTLVSLLITCTVLALLFEYWRSRGRRLLSLGKEHTLTPLEQAMYLKLLDALPDLVVLTKVGISQVLRPQDSNWLVPGSGGTPQCLDFVVYSKSFEVIVVIELDGSKRKTATSRQADEEVSRVLASSGIPHLRWKSKTPPDKATIRQAVSAIRSKVAPLGRPATGRFAASTSTGAVVRPALEMPYVKRNSWKSMVPADDICRGLGHPLNRMRPH